MPVIWEKAIESLTNFPFQCPNCYKKMKQGTLFCTDLCRDEAKFVRYFRACKKDGRFTQKDVQEALRIKLAHILGGGYKERLRKLTVTIRKAVFARDQGLCQWCGKPGNQIDHLNGSDNKLENLQLLCSRCHNKKTISNFVTISPETHPKEWAKSQALLSRVHAKKPSLVCDLPNWDIYWRSLLKTRCEILKSKKILKKG